MDDVLAALHDASRLMAPDTTDAVLRRLAEGIHDGPMQALYAAGLSLQLAEHVEGTPAAADAVAEARHHIQEVVDELRGLLRALRAGDVVRGLEAVSRAVGTPVVTHVDPTAVAGLGDSDGVELVVAASSAVAAARRRSPEPLALRLLRDGNVVVLELAGDGVAGPGAATSLERHARRLGADVVVGVAGGLPTVQLRLPA